MVFRDQYDNRGDCDCTCHGRVEKPTYTANDDGYPVESGTVNIYDEIQSHRQSVELSTLLQRYAQGDVTALNRIEGVYADVVDMPSTYSELFERVRDAENSFNALPDDVRALFDNSPVSFWQSIGTPEFASKIGQLDAKGKKNSSNSSDPGKLAAGDSAASGNNGGNVNVQKSE